MIHRNAKNTSNTSGGVVLSADSDDNIDPPEKTPKIHIEDASPSVFTFAAATATSKAQTVTYRPPSPSPPQRKFVASNKSRTSKSLVTSQLHISSLIQILATMLFFFVLYFFVFRPSHTKAQHARYINGMGSPWDNYCPDYKDYSSRKHEPYSDGPLKLPFQRPVRECRTFISDAVDKVIDDMNKKLLDKDLARLFENCYPSTLDTTVRWHIDKDQGETPGPQSFIVTGDINAEWLRDSTNQLSGYQALAKKDKKLQKLILGAINTQAEMVIQDPYCNAFQPPAGSNIKPSDNGQDDKVYPVPEPAVVFECKYEIDSLANFLSLGNQYFAHTGDYSFVKDRWLDALDMVLVVLQEQALSTFAEDGFLHSPGYTFQRQTNVGTETLALDGRGNPLARNTSLIRSAFRPSDDACILQYFVPGNAFMSVELKRTADLLTKVGQSELAAKAQKWGEHIEAGIRQHAIVDHPVYGQVFAYEIDGYGSRILMDDANLPSLLSLPLLGFVDVDDPIYQNTRKMILSQSGNPYFLKGKAFAGIGGPHIGLRYAWPMSLLVQIMTSSDDAEILGLLEMVKKVSRLGLINESINVQKIDDYTRSWFAWANSVFAQTILDLAKRKPKLIFGLNGEPYTVS